MPIKNGSRYIYGSMREKRAWLVRSRSTREGFSCDPLPRFRIKEEHAAPAQRYIDLLAAF